MIFLSLQQIHQAGVEHGDFEARNVLRGDDTPVTIDFSHSKTGHVCEGVRFCPELQRAARQLGLYDVHDGSKTDRSIFSPQIMPPPVFKTSMLLSLAIFVLLVLVGLYPVITSMDMVGLNLQVC